MKANDEAASNLEPISTNKADKNEEHEDSIDPNTKPMGDVTEIQEKIHPISEIPPTLHERFMRIKQMVKDAIAAHHTFMVYGRARVIRECMLKRGWCEKFYRKNSAGDQHYNADASPIVLLAGIGDLKDQQSERLLISKMLTNHTVDFLWNTGSEWPGWPAQDNKTTIFNRYYRAGFTSKVGLCSNVRQMHWYYEAGVANTLFPRCYNLCQGDQMHAFIEDFRFTACLNLLKWLVNKINIEGENAVRSPTGTVPLKALEFAIKRGSDYISAQSHEDIDQEVERIWAHQWDQFISWYYQIVHGQSLFIRNNVPFQKFFLASKHILKKMKKYWPQIDMDGIMNVWIMKPGNKSRGRGIVLLNKLEDVMAKMNPSTKSDTRYVIQKYIERPLLIHNTKFDIRQWFIITCSQPLTLWIYRESYLRFCSQKFSLTDFHESIHLCNHAIQCKYTNCGDRNPALPSDNMWDATTFKEFLKSQGHDKAWDDIIYPGMKQGLVGSLLASQEAMDRRKNSFELYGADFMVMDDFSVWLIEINSHPDMSYSSKVTTRLCKQVLEDTIKVVIDYREDKNASTGEFELAYKQRMSSCQPYLGAALSLQGTRITTGKKSTSANNEDSKVSLVSKSPMESTMKSAPVVRPTSNTKAKFPILTQEKIANQKHISRLSKKSHTFAGTLSNKVESPVKQSLVSKVMAFHKQTSNQKTKSSQKIEKPLKQNNDKIKTAVQDVIKKYKKNTTSVIPPEPQTLPSVLTTTNKVNQPVIKNKNNNVSKKSSHQNKNKILSDITDMYAVGLRLTN
ncbi:tubulin glycylase 3A-like isoform X4 [Apis laboriosa]|uniref:tubulin glycylase 3A-like isoform X4 n=1 Tax=Apis laboriosa TaxID=183418 RepID=UPI001CC798C3|nr:tubulin glycylase 3A-like isoform X4 [Apis laboriosa]